MLKVLLDDVVLNPSADEALRERRIIHLVGAVLAVNVAWMVATYYRSIFAAIAGHRLIRDLRVALFSHVQRLSHDFFTRHQTGAIASRVVNDISLAQNFVGSALTNVWMDAALLLALIVILISIHPMMTLISLLAHADLRDCAARDGAAHPAQQSGGAATPRGAGGRVA